MIKTSGGSYVPDLTNCDASDSGIASQLYCEIPMSVFLSSPYSLTPNTLIEAKVKAYNSNGESAFSTPNVAGVVV